MYPLSVSSTSQPWSSASLRTSGQSLLSILRLPLSFVKGNGQLEPDLRTIHVALQRITYG
jgi:hypothetical protein